MKTPSLFFLTFIFLFSCSKEIIQYKLSTNSFPGSGGKVNPGSGEFEKGSNVAITAIPEGEYLFKEWQGSLTGVNNPSTILIDSDKQVTGVFEKRPYPLNLSIEGAGTVKEEVVAVATQSNYPSGTKVKLTGVANMGWEFKEWKGDYVGTDSSFTLTVNSAKNITAVFTEIKSVSLKMNKTLINSTVSAENIQASFYNVSGPFHYESDGEHYMFYPGAVRYIANANISTFKTDHPAVASQVLKRVNGKWEHFKDDETIKFWNARNFEIIGKYIAIGDGNEIGIRPQDWKGDTYFGEIQSKGIIKWTKVNDAQNQGYFHGTALGDINNDGFMDTGGAPGVQGIGPSGMKFFTQNSTGGFKVENNLLDIPQDLAIPFTLNFTDVVGDKRAEIIMADYGGGDPLTTKDLNGISIYKFDETINKFKLHWESNNPIAFFKKGMGATSIKVIDFDNDGIKDISVAREDGDALNQYNAFEIWKGKGDGSFSPWFSSPVWSDKQLQFREFWVLDVNKDGYMDIILRPFHYGNLYRVSDGCGNPMQCNGIRFNHLIWLNKGDGTFDYYKKEDLRYEGIYIDNVHPYMDGKTLHFVGTHTLNGNIKELTTYDFRILLK